MKNEVDKTCVFRGLAMNTKTSAVLLQLVIDATKDIKDDEHKSRVLKAVAYNTNATTTALLKEVIDVAKGVKDEYSKSYVLKAVAENPNITPAKLQLVIDVAKGMKDEVWGHKSRVLEAVAEKLTRNATTEALLQKVIEATDGMKDDRDKFHVLEAVAKNEKATTAELQLVIDATDGMSERYKSDVLAAVAQTLREIARKATKESH